MGKVCVDLNFLQHMVHSKPRNLQFQQMAKEISPRTLFAVLRLLSSVQYLCIDSYSPCSLEVNAAQARIWCTHCSKGYSPSQWEVPMHWKLLSKIQRVWMWNSCKQRI